MGNRRLTYSGKVMLLLNWMYMEISNKYPAWSLTNKEITRRHGISTVFISNGTGELRKLNLIDVTYQYGKAHDTRIASYATYWPEDLYDPDELERKFKEFSSQHGDGAVMRVRELAAVVFKQNDYEDVQTLIGLEKQFGLEIVTEAVRLIADKRVANPKRKFSYLVGTIQNMAKKQEAKSTS